MILGRFRCWLARKLGGKHLYAKSPLNGAKCVRCGRPKRVRNKSAAQAPSTMAGGPPPPAAVPAAAEPIGE